MASAQNSDRVATPENPNLQNPVSMLCGDSYETSGWLGGCCAPTKSQDGRNTRNQDAPNALFSDWSFIDKLKQISQYEH